MNRSFCNRKNAVLIVIFVTFLFLIQGTFFNKVYAMTSSGGNNENMAVDPIGYTDGYSAVLYDNTNGLPTSEANAIAETSEGFIWIGSYSGLIRYDGNTFQRVDSTTGLVSVVSLFVDSKDRLWVGTNDNGVAVIDKEDILMYHKTEGLKSSTVRCITEDLNGNIYLATTNGIAIIDQSMNLRTINNPQISTAFIRDLRAGNDGIIYGTTNNNDVFTLEGGKLTNFYDREHICIDGIMTVLPDPLHPGFVYFGTELSEIYYGELESGFVNPKVIDISPLSYIKSIEQFQEQIWICTDNGIGVLQDDTVHILENIPINNSIEHVMIDYAGNLWFTSSRQGVMKIVPNQFSDIFEKYDLPSVVVNSTCKYGNMLFIGTDSGLFVIDDEKEIESFPISKAITASGVNLEFTDLIQMLKGCRIRSIIRDSNGGTWFSTWKRYGLIHYQDGVVTCFNTEDGMPSNRVRTIYEGKNGRILAACTGGIAIIQDKQIIRVLGEKSGIENTEILTVSEAENGDIVLGSDGGGIYVISDVKTTHIGTEDGLNSEVVMRIKRDASRSLFWIVTSNSIAYMSEEDYRVTTIQRFPYSNNFDIYENSNEDVWILSSNGIYVVPAEELIANEEITPVFYGSDNGIPCITTANSYSELTKDGELYIAGTTGVAKVNIEKTFESVNDVKIAVPYVEADESLIYPDDEGTFTIPSDVKKLTIFSYVFTYSLLNPQVTYYLDGFEQVETTVDRRNLVPIDYTNLKGGNYHFVIQLKDSMGRGNKEISVFIVKQKAFYEEIWFIILCVILGLLVIGIAVRIHILRRLNAYKKQEEENQALIRGITQAFAKTIDMKDKYTNGHSSRVALYTVKIARELGYNEKELDKFYKIALLHDIGKIGIPEEVLNKPGKLTDEEYNIIKSHTSLGYDALKEITIMPELAVGARSHHERPDGKGYPDGLNGDEIPREAQIIAVADAFDAMYSNRPYRNRMNFDRVVSIIKEASGTQLMPDVVDAFLRLVKKGEFRDPNDHGGGATEDIDNIRRRLREQESNESMEE